MRATSGKEDQKDCDGFCTQLFLSSKSSVCVCVRVCACVSMCVWG